MALDDVRRVLRSAERNVLIEAPAGCGKTFEAAALAVELGRELPSGAEVLLLAHTNAAVQEVVRRTRGTGARVRATTIDAFCLDVLSPYAAALAMPTPLRRAVGTGNVGVPFSDLAPAAARLLSRCPSIATALAHRYPMVLLDEHQDASIAQHEMATSLCRAEHCRVRVFADPMQAIYEDADNPRISWDQLRREAGVTSELDVPQRWAEDRDLGAWILAARLELANGRPLPLRGAPPTVTVTRVAGMDCVGRYGKGNAGLLARPINEFIARADGSVAVLSRHRNHVWGLHVAALHRLSYNEGAEFEDAYKLLTKAEARVGDAQQLAWCLLDHFRGVSSGLTTQKQRAVAGALQADRIEYGRQRVLRPFIERFQALYTTPTIAAFCAVAGTISAIPPEGIRVRMPMTMRLLGQLRPGEADSKECLDEAVGRLKALARQPTRVVSTIHKAKGLEFNHVLISNFSAGHFGDDEMSRRIAYVAISRARRSLSFLVPALGPSPLLGA